MAQVLSYTERKALSLDKWRVLYQKKVWTNYHGALVGVGVRGSASMDFGMDRVLSLSLLRGSIDVWENLQRNTSIGALIDDCIS